MPSLMGQGMLQQGHGMLVPKGASHSAMQQNGDVRKLFTCPASGKVLLDPALCADGYTYDSSWLQEWLVSLS